MKLKRFNEDFENKYKDHKYDYTEWVKPITKDEVKEVVIDELRSLWEGGYEGDFVLTEELESDVDVFANRTMHAFRDTLNYLGENNKEDFLDMLNGDFK